VQTRRIEDFILATNNSYNVDQLKEMEIDILTKCHFHLTPPTTFEFLNILIQNWNCFCDYKNNFINQNLKKILVGKNAYSSSLNRISHGDNYCDIMSLIDKSYLNLNLINIRPSIIAASALYLVCSTNFFSIKKSELFMLLKTFWKICLTEFNNLYDDFLKSVINFKMSDLEIPLHYLSYYLLFDYQNSDFNSENVINSNQ